ncbi:TetR/AcrR family transcriptional regulator [Streptomyces sp. NPDC047023]|uniref:TetR/AcrR family transcriptional regulator n=1 Tax=Streptomyces sp. NPDC047023 TaxID=3155139 RepID=UPI0033C10F37
MVSPHASSTNPRVQRTRARIMAVARELLTDVGPMALTYSLLAERSGVTRQTLYRHWPSREILLVDLVLSGEATDYPEPGADPRAVVTGFLRSLRQGMEDPSTGAALLTLAAEADGDPESANVLAIITEDRRKALNALLEPAALQVTREEFALLTGPVLFTRFISRQPVSDDAIDRIVAHWLDSGGSPKADRARRTGKRTAGRS